MMTSFMPSLDQFIVWIVVRLAGGRPPLALAVGMPGGLSFYGRWTGSENQTFHHFRARRGLVIPFRRREFSRQDIEPVS
jgi:hypothetical protein